MDAPTVNTTLAIWGGLAPLLTAGATAWWTRKVQTDNSDKEEREKKRDRIYRDRSEQRKALSERSDNEFRHRRDTYIEFYGASYDVVFHAMPGENDLPRDPDQANARLERLSKAYSTLMIIEKPLIGQVASSLWDATINIASSQVEGRSFDAMADERKALQLARHEFSSKAHEILISHLAGVEEKIKALGDPLDC